MLHPPASLNEIQNSLVEAKQLSLQGQTMAAVGLFQDAAKLMERLPEFLSPMPLDPAAAQLANVYFQIGDCYSQLQDNQMALHWYVKGQDYRIKHSFQKEPSVLCSMAEACRNLEQWDNAIALYLQAVEGAASLNVPLNHADVHYNLACAYEVNGDLMNAIDHLEKCLTYKPNDQDALFNLGMFSAQNGNFVRAAQALESFLKIEPNGDGANQAREALSQIYRNM